MKKNGKYCQFSLLKCYFCRFSDLIISIPKIKYLHILKRTIGANRWQARTKGCSSTPLDQWVSTVLEMNDLEMQVIGLLLPFTGLRVKEFIHFHGPTWLSWKGDGSDTTYGEIPVMKVPARANCFRKGANGPCNLCESNDGGKFETKYDDERTIPLVETWKNHGATDKEQFVEQDLPLRELTRTYFKVSRSDVGNELIGGDGLSANTVNKNLVVSQSPLEFSSN